MPARDNYSDKPGNRYCPASCGWATELRGRTIRSSRQAKVRRLPSSCTVGVLERFGASPRGLRERWWIHREL